MQKYKDIFLSNGFEDLESVLELRDEDFNVMNIPLGHKLKMLKKIKELRPPEPKPQPAQNAAPLHGIQRSAESAKNVYQELPSPEKMEKNEKMGEHPVNPGEEEKKIEAKKLDPKKMVRFGESAVIIEIAGTEIQYENAKERGKENSKNSQNVKKVHKEMESGDAGDLVPLSENEEKECCWHCYKLFVKGTGFADRANKKV